MTLKTWNWQQDDWPDFSYDKKKLDPLENEYTKESGISIGVLRHLSKEDLDEFRIEIICNEALKTSGLIIRSAIITNLPFLFYFLALQVKACFQQAIQTC